MNRRTASSVPHSEPGLRAKKSLGQHFLSSPTALAKIVEAAHISAGETVLEIGPGTGILTAAILATGAHVIAVEKDDRAMSLLGARFSKEISTGQLELRCADILEEDRASLGLREGGYALVANIPYYITGAILESFLEYEPRPDRAVLLVQKEVAERIIARDGRGSLLSISVKAFGEPRIIATVPRGAFAPPPNVDSAILSIERVSAARFIGAGVDIRRFFAILKAGFAHKRKKLASNLGEIMDDKEKLTAAFEKAGIGASARAEELSIDHWTALASAI